ncbi:methyltransferase domain-containing protein [Ekhidna sp.]|uniref:methyltransferase domain-containing protein n=1 Tax=Ekhidna sp. TaxID=2608089 RepID=UPI0032977080
MSLDQSYWEKRYQEGSTGWDTGGPTKPLTSYIDQLADKEIRILIPGAGNAYEAEYLFNKGFKHVYIIDLAKQPLDNFKNRVPDFPENQLIREDFFNHEGSYDLILEQTFFCAIDPSLRASYVRKTKSLLNPSGKLVGVLWSIPMNEGQPPYGGSIAEYQKLFHTQFKIYSLSPCYNSIKPRMGNEVFIHIEN